MMAMVMTSVIKLNQNEKVIIKVEVRGAYVNIKRHACMCTYS